MAARRLRHWKQRYQPGARFVFSRQTRWGDRAYEPGDLIPDDLAGNRNRLRRLWDARRIELEVFEAPDVGTGQPPDPQDGHQAAQDSDTGDSGADSANGASGHEAAQDGDQGDDAPPPPPLTHESRGAWHTVRTPDGEQRVRGLVALEALYAKYGQALT